MKIWIINNANMLPEHGHLNRHYYYGKYLQRLGHDVTVFVGSHPHNTNLQLIEGKERYCVYKKEPFPWVLIKTRNYEGSRYKRVISMFEFYFNMKYAAKHFEKPDVIIGSSTHPLAALVAIQLSKKMGCEGIIEIRDLWPESIVSYGLLKRTSIIAKTLYAFERYLYTHADKIIFTMENAYEYIIDKGWSEQIPESKIYYLNNGVDLEEFEENLKQCSYVDKDLSDSKKFKVVYTGSIRRVNNLDGLLDAAKKTTNPKIKYLIWGDGDHVDAICDRIKNEAINNVIYKGYAQKKFIPSITSQADLNYMHGQNSSVLKYGLSANKLFDYAAAGKPILTDFEAGMNPAVVFGAGVFVEDPTPEKIAAKIDELSGLQKEKYCQYCENAKKMALSYSYKNLAMKLIEIIMRKDK